MTRDIYDREELLEEWLRKIADRLEKSAEILDSDETTRMQRHNYAMMAKHYIQTMTYATGVKLV